MCSLTHSFESCKLNVVNHNTSSDIHSLYTISCIHVLVPTICVVIVKLPLYKINFKVIINHLDRILC